MNSFCNTVGNLKVVIAKGYISTYEISKLEKGDKVYFYDRECGMPCSLYFNDRLVSLCKIVIIDNKFAARLDDSHNIPISQFTKPLLEDRELHNSELVLGTREITLAELSKLTKGSIVSFNTLSDFSPSIAMKGTLLVSGIEVALGKIGISNEKWALEISDYLLDRDKDISRRDSHLPMDDNFKTYDFSRPDCITKSNFKAFNRIHSFFSNYINCKINEIDQMTWGELKKEYSNFDLLVLRKDPIERGEIKDALYYLPMDNLNSDQSIENMAKEWALESNNLQIMEKVGVLYDSQNAYELFSSQLDSTRALLEASWRDIEYITLGEKFDLPITTNEFVEDWSMIVTVKIKYESSEVVLVYPLQFFEQLLERM